MFTLNNWDDKDVEDIRNLGSQYVVFGKEVGENGTHHLQGYVYFKSARTLSSLKKKLKKAHFEPRRGSHEQARDYCLKDGDYEEIGTPPVSQKEKGEKEKERWEAAWACAKVGDFDGIDKDILMRCYRTCKEIRKDYMADVQDAEDVTGVWFYGAAGVGKSRRARDEYPKAYLKMCNKWWDGYQEEPHVIIDDLDKGHAVLGHHLKIWGDRYCFLAETKGGAIKIRPKTIIVTSQYHPDDIWEDDETRSAIRRRFKITHIVNI